MSSLKKDPIFLTAAGVFVFGLALFLLRARPENAHGTIPGASNEFAPSPVKQWVVDASGGQGADASSLEQVWKRIKPGDSILLRPGKYPAKLDVDFDVTLRGESADSTVLVGDEEYLLRVRSGHVQLENIGMERLSPGLLLETSGGHLEMMRSWIHLSQGDQLKLQNSKLNVTDTVISTSSTVAPRLELVAGRGTFLQCAFKGIAMTISGRARYGFQDVVFENIDGMDISSDADVGISKSKIKKLRREILVMENAKVQLRDTWLMDLEKSPSFIVTGQAFLEGHGVQAEKPIVELFSAHGNATLILPVSVAAVAPARVPAAAACLTCGSAVPAPSTVKAIEKIKSTAELMLNVPREISF